MRRCTSEICFCHSPKRISWALRLSNPDHFSYFQTLIITPSLSDILTPTITMPNDGFSVQAVAQAARSPIESSKRLAAYTAVDHHVRPQHVIIGIGSGSTVPYVVERIVQQGVEANKKRVFIPTGFQSKQLIVEAGLSLGDVDEHPSIDVTIDGADEIDANLNCIKGGGACHLREKVLAEAAKTFVVVADYRKNSEYLGASWKPGVPVEVVPFAYARVLRQLREVMGSPNATLRMAVKKAGPIVTDNGNFVIDAPFGQEKMQDPSKVLTQIKLLTGVVEVGLFCGMAKAAYFGNQDGTVTIRREDGTTSQVEA
ncbi:ribose-5-phosphate isomerase rki1 [Leucoagaricus gongylophorus]